MTWQFHMLCMPDVIGQTVITIWAWMNDYTAHFKLSAIVYPCTELIAGYLICVC